MKKSIFSLALGCTAYLLTMMVSGTASSASCQPAENINALNFRQLQVELMVSAIKCKNYYGGLHEKYNKYIKIHTKSLKNNAKDLNRAFKNNNEKDRYISYLSNEASIRSLYIDNYCGLHSQLFNMVLEMKPEELHSWIKQYMPTPSSIIACTPPISRR